MQDGVRRCIYDQGCVWVGGCGYGWVGVSVGVDGRGMVWGGGWWGGGVLRY